MKQFITIILAVLMFMTVSCAGKTSADELFDEDLGAVSGLVDLGGYDFSIRFYNYFSVDSLFGYRENSAFNDAVIKRISEVENSLNCSITYTNSAGQDLESNFMPMLISGQRFCDAVMSSSYNLRPTIEAEMFEPLSQVSDIIDYRDSRKWGNWRILEQSVWNGDIYGVVPVQWPDIAMSSGYMFVFNEKYAELLAQPDPREYIENGTWSRDQLGEMMTTYTTDDLGYPLKALLTYEGHFYDTALRANNAQTYKFLDGKYVSGYHTPEGYDALKWADDFLHSEYVDCILLYNNDNDGYPRFINGDSALFFTSIMNIFGSDASIPYEVESFCVLPMPNGPEREKTNALYTTFFEWVRSNIFFPINGSIDCSAYIADALFEPLDGFGEQELKDYYLRYYYHNEQDFELTREVFENSRYSFYSDGMRSLVVEALYGSHSKTVTEILDSTETAQNERVLKYIVPTVSSLEEIFGVEVLQ